MTEVDNTPVPLESFFKDRFNTFLTTLGETQYDFEVYAALVKNLKDDLGLQRDNYLGIANALDDRDFQAVLSGSLKQDLREKASEARKLGEAIDRLIPDAEGLLFKDLPAITEEDRTVREILETKAFDDLNEVETALLGRQFGPQFGSEASYDKLVSDVLPVLAATIHFEGIQRKYKSKIKGPAMPKRSVAAP